MSVVVLVFALNLFGVFEIKLPQWLIAASPRNRPDMATRAHFSKEFLRLSSLRRARRRFSEPRLALPSLNRPLLSWRCLLDRRRHESALFFVKRTTRLAAIPAEAGPMDGTGETADGFSASRNVALFLSVLGAQRGVDAVIWTCAFLLVLSVVCWMKGAFVTPIASARTTRLVLVAHAPARNR